MNVGLSIDFFFVDGIAFFHTISNDIQFRRIDTPKSHNKQCIIIWLKKVIQTYQARGFNIGTIYGNDEFDCLRNDFRPTTFDIATPGQRVPRAERSIRTIKDGTRCAVLDLTYIYWTKLMTKSYFRYKVLTLNSFPSQVGVSSELRPANIVLGSFILDNKHFSIDSGAYAIVHHENATNTNLSPGHTSDCSRAIRE